MKKVIAVLLAAAMVLSMAGCSAGTSTGTGAAETAASAAAAKAAAAEGAGAESAATEGTAAEGAAAVAGSTWLCPEKTTITVMTYEGPSGLVPPSNDLLFWQKLEEYTNVHVDWEVLPSSGYEEVVATKVSSGADLADVVMVYDCLLGNNAGKNGLFLNLNDYWDTCFTNTEAYMTANGTNYRGMLQNEDGSFYFLSSPCSPKECRISVMYNTEWMDKLGLKIPTTLDEFNEVARAMKAAGDLNGNGKDDEVILSSTDHDALASDFGSAFGLSTYEDWPRFGVKNDTVFSEYTSDNMKAYLSWINQLYDEGILDPEINNMDGDLLSEKVAQDRVGIFVYYSAFAWIYGSLCSAGQADPMGEHYTLGVPLATEYNNYTPYCVRRDRADDLPTCINAKTENPELVCKWLDTMFADPVILDLRCNGEEGIDYTRKADGSIELIQPADGSAWSIDNKGCGQLALAFIQTDDMLHNLCSAYPWWLKEYENIRSCEWHAPAIPNVVAYTNTEQEKLDEVRTDCIDYWEEYRAKFAIGDLDVDADWEKYVSNFDKIGLPTFTEVYQSVYDRTK